MADVKVTRGGTTITVSESALQSYLDRGYEVVTKTKATIRVQIVPQGDNIEPVETVTDKPKRKTRKKKAE